MDTKLPMKPHEFFELLAKRAEREPESYAGIFVLNVGESNKGTAEFGALHNLEPLEIVGAYLAPCPGHYKR